MHWRRLRHGRLRREGIAAAFRRRISNSLVPSSPRPRAPASRFGSRLFCRRGPFSAATRLRHAVARIAAFARQRPPSHPLHAWRTTHDSAAALSGNRLSHTGRLSSPPLDSLCRAAGASADTVRGDWAQPLSGGMLRSGGRWTCSNGARRAPTWSWGRKVSTSYQWFPIPRVRLTGLTKRAGDRRGSRGSPLRSERSFMRKCAQLFLIVRCI